MTGRRREQSGATFLLMLFAVAALGLGLAQFGAVWATTVQREREEELIFIGGEFSRALLRFQQAQAPALPPQSLEELVSDPRVPFPRRHLRRIYRDPMTGKADWIVERVGGRVTGVRSRSEKIALRRTSLPAWVKVAGEKDEPPSGPRDLLKDAAKAPPPSGLGKVGMSPLKPLLSDAGSAEPKRYTDWIFRPVDPLKAAQPTAAPAPQSPQAASAAAAR